MACKPCRPSNQTRPSLAPSPAISPVGAHGSCVFIGRRAPIKKGTRHGRIIVWQDFIAEGTLRVPPYSLFPPVGAVLLQLQGFPANQPSWPANHAGHQTRPARLLYPADGKTGDVDHDHRPSYTEGSGGRSSDASPRTRAGDVKKGERQVILTGSSMVIFPSLLLIPSCRNNEFHRFILNSQLNKILLDKTEHMCYY